MLVVDPQRSLSDNLTRQNLQDARKYLFICVLNASDNKMLRFEKRTPQYKGRYKMLWCLEGLLKNTVR